jgi:GNAT superfamily N-acetyltransferase
MDFVFDDPSVVADVASLHCGALPGSLISRLGKSYARSFYRYCCSSRLETVLAAMDGRQVVAGACVSLAPSSLSQRLLLRTPLMAYMALRPTLAWHAALGIAASTAIPREIADAPEVVALMTADGRRSEGIGKAMIERIEAHLQRRYFVRTHNSDAHPTVRFYRREGFEPAGVLSAHGDEFLLLKKECRVRLPP